MAIVLGGTSNGAMIVENSTEMHTKETEKNTEFTAQRTYETFHSIAVTKFIIEDAFFAASNTVFFVRSLFSDLVSSSLLCAKATTSIKTTTKKEHGSSIDDTGKVVRFR